MEQIQRCFPQARVELPKPSVYRETVHKDEKRMPETPLILNRLAPRTSVAPWTPLRSNFGHRDLGDIPPQTDLSEPRGQEAPKLGPIREDSTATIDETAPPPAFTHVAQLLSLEERSLYLLDSGRGIRGMIGIPSDEGDYYGVDDSGPTSVSTTSGNSRRVVRGQMGLYSAGGSIASSRHTVSTAPTSYVSYGSRGAPPPSWQMVREEEETKKHDD